MTAKIWTHKELVADLASSLFSDGYITSESRYGSAWMSAAPIPDVLKIRKSYTRIDVQMFEVKVSRSDFLAELRKGKWVDYLKRSTRLSFATPGEGVVNDAQEIPEDCGWIARGPAGWRVRRPPKIRVVEPTYEEALALLMGEHERAQRLARDVEALRKVKHRHNVHRNAQMHARLRRYEEDVRRRADARERHQGALRKLRELTGLSLDRWGYTHDLERWVERHKNGNSATTSDLKRILACSKEITLRLEDILGQKKQETDTDVN